MRGEGLVDRSQYGVPVVVTKKSRFCPFDNLNINIENREDVSTCSGVYGALNELSIICFP